MKTFLLAIQRWRLMRLGVTCGERIRVKGFPIVYKHPSASIVLGNEVILHSRPNRYHAHMHSPVKLLADADGAEIVIGEQSRVNGACIHAVRSVRIGARCLIAAGAQIIDSNGHEACLNFPNERIRSVDKGRPIVIEDDVWIGLNAIVLPGTFIRSGSIIGAGAIVSGDIPPSSIVKPSSCLIVSQAEKIIKD